jgi:hypothetical protein
MTSMNEALTKAPSDFFLGVIEYDKTITVGILDEPLGIELTAVRLAYPLEMIQSWTGQNIQQLVIVPECGVPEEVIVDADSVAIHHGGSAFGKTYFENLRNLASMRPEKYLSRPVTKAQLAGKGG